MSLASHCKGLFDSHIRGRGEEYFHSGLVGPPILSQARDLARFPVRGSRKYEVIIDWSDLNESGTVRFECDCPHYSDGNACKHLWAAIRKFDSDGLSQRLISMSDEIDPVLESSDDISELKPEYKEVTPRTRYHSRPAPVIPPHRKPKPFWQMRLESIQRQNLIRKTEEFGAQTRSKNPRSAYFLFDLEETRNTGKFTVQFYVRETTKSGKIGALKYQKVEKEDVALYPDPLDKEIMALLLTTGLPVRQSYYYYSQPQKSGKAVISQELYKLLLPKLCDSGKLLHHRRNDSTQTWSFEPLTLDKGAPWKLELRLEREKTKYEVKGNLIQEAESRDLTSALVILRDGLIAFPDRLAWHDSTDHFGWFTLLRERDGLNIPVADGDDWVQAFYQDNNPPGIVWPDELRWESVVVDPEPHAMFTSSHGGANNRGILLRLSFKYGDKMLSSLESHSFALDRSQRRILKRNLPKESETLERLRALQLDLPPIRLTNSFNYKLNARDFVQTAKELLSWGWKVEAEGKKIQEVREFEVGISSGIDWLDLKGKATYANGLSIELPALLAALKRGDGMVALDDGTLGMLPEEWLSKYSVLATFGMDTKDSVRFRKSQAVLIDSWLERDTNLKVDAAFSNLRKKLHTLSTSVEDEAPSGFSGQLRPYQREGLSWLRFLNECEIGGILADDMGLGKTVQVLAHLERQRINLRKKPHDKRPSLAIVPKSLVFNWIEEAQRFVPSLNVLNYTGAEREGLIAQFPHSDLIVTTYATLRLDLEKLRTFEFNYVILDEAQAIKNRDALTSLACKQVQGRHKLIMTGTPVENSLDDLFSLMDFANPGLLGQSTMDRLSRVTRGGQLDKEAIEPLSKALRPFILRRTKTQVLKDLPEKTEKILHCELSPTERQQYDELKSYFQRYLNQKIKDVGMGRAKFAVLEALLRLRQAACHPGLLDPKKKKATSTKLDTLVERVKEVVSEGHKALIFSQFTTFLDIVAKRFNAEKISYEYLDGKTHNRKDRVEQFQENAQIQTFLISLKAGGVGLNLTAADYVFILDPWWNPAVESQAIDRTHRIGQRKRIMAYRLIAKETVEEKILSLQSTKRELADAIVNADSSLLRKLTFEDIRILME